MRQTLEAIEKLNHVDCFEEPIEEQLIEKWKYYTFETMLDDVYSPFVICSTTAATCTAIYNDFVKCVASSAVENALVYSNL